MSGTTNGHGKEKNRHEKGLVILINRGKCINSVEKSSENSIEFFSNPKELS